MRIRGTGRNIAAALTVLVLTGTVLGGNAVYKEEEIDAARENIVNHDWAGKIRETLLVEADRWAGKSDDELCDLIRAVTPRDSETTCPIDGEQLDCHLDDPWVAVCRKCGRKFPDADWPDDGTGFKQGGQTFHFIGNCNGQHFGVLTGAAHDLALAYALTGKVEYARKAAVILTRMAQVYPGFELHADQKPPPFYAGKFRPSTLQETGWVKLVVAAYELIRDARTDDGEPVVTEERRKTIENGLLREAAGLLMRSRYGIHNIQAAQDSGVAAVGVCLDDPEMIHHAIDGPYGFNVLLANGVLDDGFWCEGSMSYHLFTLGFLMQTAHFTRGYSDAPGVTWTNGRKPYEHLDLREGPGLRRMVEVVNRAALPDGSIPTFGDCRPVEPLTEIQTHPEYYRLHDMWAARVERTPFHQMIGSDEFVRLFQGGMSLPLPQAQPPQSTAWSLAGFGMAVLRSDLDRDCDAVALDHSLQVGGHPHLDLFQVLPMVGGKMMSNDFGYMGGWHRTDRHDWSVHTVAHNTVVVDRVNQSPDAFARLEILNQAGPVRLMQASGVNAYPRCKTYERAVVMVGRDYWLDLFRVDGGTSHEYAFHVFGSLSVNGLSDAVRKSGRVSESPGFNMLRDFDRGVTGGNWEAVWRTPGETPESISGLRMVMLGSPETTVRFGQAYGAAENESIPMILAQRVEPRSQFISVFEPLRGTPRIRHAKRLCANWSDGTDRPAVVVEVTGEDWTDHIEFSPRRQSSPARWSLARTGQDRMRFLYVHNGARATADGWTLESPPPVQGEVGALRRRPWGTQMLLDLPVQWGPAVGGTGLLTGGPTGRLGRYFIDELEPVGDTAWAQLASGTDLVLSVFRADRITVPDRLIRSEVPMARRAELIGKPIYRANGEHLGTVEEIRQVVREWQPYGKNAMHPAASPLLIRTSPEAKLESVLPGEMLYVRDVGPQTPLTMETFALVWQSDVPDTYRISAPFGARLTVPASSARTAVRWRLGDTDWNTLPTSVTKTETGLLIDVAFPLAALVQGPVDFQLRTE